MGTVRPLGKRSSSRLNGIFAAAAASAGVANAFNPSIASQSDSDFIAFRGSATGERPFRAFVASSESGLLDLSEVALASGLPVVADPKLFRLGNELWATFNTGFTASAENGIYIQRIHPDLTEPQLCILPGRQRIEKNWAFYLDESGDLSVVYSLDPLKILRRSQGGLGNGPLTFAHVESPLRSRAAGLTIGTQLSGVVGDSMILIAHQKLQFAGKRAYFGRAVELDLAFGNEQIVSVGQTWLIHSLASLLPARRRPNPNLISATYFAGIVQRDRDVILSYGVNDISGNVVSLERQLLW
jgi:hypothetical protein